MARAGTTLTEVLMSLMIMSIGIVSVATLFPISTLRTLEASKLTNSKIASLNAEAAIDARPELVHNPDDGIPKWISVLLPEPPAAGSVATESDVNRTRYDGGAFLDIRTYVVDPWGFYEMPATGNLNTEFGNIGGTALPGFPVDRRVRRFRAWLPDAIQAAHFVSHPDNWKVVTEAALDPTGAQSALSLTLDVEGDLSSISGVTGSVATQTVIYRATIFDADGTGSETRLLSANPTGQQVTWASPLPTRVMEDQNGNGTLDPGEDYDGDGVLDLPSRVRVEVADQVYTWMLSVHMRPEFQGDNSCLTDAVIFYKRGFDPAFEEVHTADFRVNQIGPDDIPDTADDIGPDGIPGTADDTFGLDGIPGTADDTPPPNYRVRVQFTGDRPAARRGGYVFDTANGFWYRINAVERETDTEMYLVLENEIRARNDVGGVNQGGAILHPNVVNVFPLGSK
jgi:hypothetical protein